MKKLSEEYIQDLLESKQPSSDILSASEQQQLESYRSLFKILNKEPEKGLRPGFSLRVTGELKTKSKKRSDILFNLFVLFGIIVVLIIGCGSVMLIDFNSGSNFLQVMLKFKWLLISGTFTLLGSLIFEQIVVEKN